MIVHNGSKSDSAILDSLTLKKSRVIKGSKLIIITAEKNNEQLLELWKRLNPHCAIEIYIVEKKDIEKFSFSRYNAFGDNYQYIVKYNSEDKNGVITEHINVSEKAFIDNLIENSCVEGRKYAPSTGFEIKSSDILYDDGLNEALK